MELPAEINDIILIQMGRMLIFMDSIGLAREWNDYNESDGKLLVQSRIVNDIKMRLSPRLSP